MSAIATLALVIAEVFTSIGIGAVVSQPAALVIMICLMLSLAFVFSSVASCIIIGLHHSWTQLLNQDALKPSEWVGLTIYAGTAGLVTVNLGLALGDFVHRSFRQVGYQHLALILVTLALLISLALLYAPIRGLAAKCSAKINRIWTMPRLSRVQGGLLSAIVVAIFIWMLPKWLPLLDSVDERPIWLTFFWGTALILSMIFMQPRSGGSLRLWFAAIAVIVLSPILANSLLAINYPALGVLERETVLSRRALGLFRRVTDQDGDGASAMFGGGDCDDANPLVRPGRLDLPNDGIDQNCSGKDYSLGKVTKRKNPSIQNLKSSEAKPHVVVLTVDALRYDRIKVDMPFLTRLSKESINFEHAYSHGASTYWSVASMMTSKLPSRLKMGRDQTPTGDQTLLAEVLQRGGWRTTLFANVTIFFVRGLSQGFQHRDKNYATSHYTVHGEKPGSKHLTDGMLKKLSIWKKGGNQQPVFLWGHYYDPHDPYFPIAGHPAEGSDDFSRYRAIVRSVDAQIERFVAGLKKLGMWDNTILIITSDHGEEFGEHGGRFHGKTMYEEMTRVPLLMRVPNLKPRAIETPVGQIDIAPTLLGLLGLTIPAEFQGTNHAVSLLKGAEIEAKPVVMEVLPDSNYGGHIIGVRDGRQKVMYHVRSHLLERYDLIEDPLEKENLGPSTKGSARLVLDLVDEHLYHLAFGKTGAKLPLGTPKGFGRKARRP